MKHELERDGGAVGSVVCPILSAYLPICTTANTDDLDRDRDRVPA